MKKIWVIGGIVGLLAIAGLSGDTENKNNVQQNNTIETTEKPTQTAREKKLLEKKTSLAQRATYDNPLRRVAGIIDGDTIKVDIDGKIEKVRLIGLDTPETSHPSKPVQCFGKEATSKMQSLAQSKKVYLYSDDSQDTRDKYGRLLRYAFLEDGRNIAYEMIKQGYAHEYTYNLPYEYQKQFKDAQKHAESSKLGLWADNTCGGNTEKPAEKPKPAPTPVQKNIVNTAPQPQPQTQAQAQPAPQNNCDPNYTPCVPNVTYDLDCKDIGFMVHVIGTDRHRFDGKDNDGLGCESYR